MKTKLLLITFVLATCAATTPSPPAPIPNNWYDNYQYSWDLGIGECPEYPSLPNDLSVTKSNGVMTFTVNPQPGAFVGGILSNPIDYAFTDNTKYSITGYLKWPSGSKVEQIDVNLQYVDIDNVEHYGELIWTLNPYSPKYGYVWTRTEPTEYLPLFKITPNHGWHWFRLDVVHAGAEHYITRIQMDNKYSNPNLVQGEIPDKGYAVEDLPYFSPLLETSNMYTNCDPANDFTGMSQWKDVQVYTEPWVGPLPTPPSPPHQ